MNRPEYCERAVKSVRKHLTEVVDHIVVVNDGSDAKHNGAYRRVEKAVQSFGGNYVPLEVNGGVAKAKNTGIRYLLNERKCDVIFVMEDDLIIQSSDAVTEYLRVMQDTGVSHFAFAHHGPANIGGPVETVGEVEYYGHSVGAWTMFTADDLNEYGLLDEQFHNSMEHVEHEIRLGVLPHRFPDIANSARLIQEIPGSIEKSSIRPRSDWASSVRESLVYWRDNKPETFDTMFGTEAPLHQWAMSIIG
jgi:glycosyltransferase involved in cell wall biosynthesis